MPNEICRLSVGCTLHPVAQELSESAFHRKVTWTAGVWTIHAVCVAECRHEFSRADLKHLDFHGAQCLSGPPCHNSFATCGGVAGA